jgi:superfamily II DNA or RNA helicase
MVADVTAAYVEFLKRKTVVHVPAGLDVSPSALHPELFPFQRDIVAWALRIGRAAVFADCGLGKTLMQLEWARRIPGRCLILAPLAVAHQTVREGRKFGVDVTYDRTGKDGADIVVANYEMLEHFEPSSFSGIVLDESSILKNYTGKTRNAVIEAFAATPYRLACTATPAPNDHMELGNHAEFLGVMSRVEMLSMFFVHDGGETQKWRLKGHAESEFWRWLSSWGVFLRAPSDLGYEDDGFALPPIRHEQVTVETPSIPSGSLFSLESKDMTERIAARRDTVQARAGAAAAIVNEGGTWIVWCNLNAEAESATRFMDGAVNVKGSDSLDAKERALDAFTDGETRVLVTKPSICGHGMNWQHCSNVLFLGLSDSWEQYYQAIRRVWRFGQVNEVRVVVVTADIEGDVRKNIERKEKDAARLAEEMVTHMDISQVRKPTLVKVEGEARKVRDGKRWVAVLGDSVEEVRRLDADSVGYSIFSPPFASLYTYSASPRDMGNCKDDDTFHEHFRFLVSELLRVTAPGRLCSFHCFSKPTSKTRDGFIGLTDFRGELIRAFTDAAWIFHSEVCIWKDPVTAVQRTKALGLLHKQVEKDSCMNRQAIPDYLITMRKPGENPAPVAGNLMEKYAACNMDGAEVARRLNVAARTSFIGRPGSKVDATSVNLWQLYASPVWMDINPSNTLQKESAREDKDERHICPLQLDVIERALILWSNVGDLVLSPFMGIGSEGYQALLMGRRFAGVELKESYWRQACANLKRAEGEQQSSLF